MPQMAPLIWSILFTFFSILLIFSMAKIFFLKTPQVPTVSMARGSLKYKKSWQW